MVALRSNVIRPAVTASGKVALLWSILGLGGLSLLLICLTVSTERKSELRSPQVAVPPSKFTARDNQGDSAMGYPETWKNRRIVAINRDPPSGAEVTFLEVDDRGRVISPERTEFVGYNELHYLERRERRALTP